MKKLCLGALAPAALVAAMSLAPGMAQAAPCDGVGAEQPFAQWHDRGSYVLVAGGDFESGADGWTLSDGAAITPGGNSLRPSSSATSLGLPAGGTATTPAICVAKGDPVARIFTRTLTSAKRPDTLGVEVLYLDSTGAVRKVKKAGSLRGSDEWAPSRKFSLAQGQFNGHAKPKPNRSAQIELRFTAVSGSWQIDDVFVDPHARR